jgi:tetratricopeptide (TPR) repeat protein
MPDVNDPAEAKSIAPSTSRALVTQSSSVVRRGLALANALLSRQDAEAYYKAGNEKIYDNYRQAVEDFTRAIEIDPDFAEAYNARAFCFGHLRERQKALQDQEAVIRLRPHDYSAYLSRAGSHKILGN